MIYNGLAGNAGLLGRWGAPSIGDHGKGLRVIAVLPALCLGKDLRGKGGKQNVTVNCKGNKGEDDCGGKSIALGEYLSATDNKDLFGPRAEFQCLVEGAGQLHPRRGERRVAAEDDMAAARQRLAYRFEGAPAHDHRVTHGGLFEKAQLGGDVPWQLIVSADDPVAGHCDNDNDIHDGPVILAI